jgi:hypothetical protein
MTKHATKISMQPHLKQRLKARPTQQQNGFYHRPLTTAEKLRGVAVVDFVPFEALQDQATPVPCSFIIAR